MEGLASINDARLPGGSEIEFAAMLRGIGAVVVGYLVMAVAVFVIFSAMFAVIGQERAFEPGSYAVTWFWLVPAFIVSIIAAMLGGFVCTRLSPGRAPQILAALVLVLGVALALPVLSPGNDPRPTTRPAGISDIEAMGNARQPPMVALLNPLIGCVGVLLGARRTKI